MKNLGKDDWDIPASMIKNIVKIRTNTYQLTVELNNGDFVETVCRVVVSETANGEAVQSFKFDSDEFQRAVMLGKIDVRAICAAIEEFHSQPD